MEGLLQGSAGGQPPITRAFRAHPAALHEIRRFLRDLAIGAGLPDEWLEDVVLAVSEACANVIVHTNTAKVVVTCRFSPMSADVEVRDRGVFRPNAPGHDNEGEECRGIPLMIALMDEVTIREGTSARPGTVVRLVKSQPRRTRDGAA